MRMPPKLGGLPRQRQSSWTGSRRSHRYRSGELAGEYPLDRKPGALRRLWRQEQMEKVRVQDSNAAGAGSDRGSQRKASRLHPRRLRRAGPHAWPPRNRNRCRSKTRVSEFSVAVPSWGVGVGGTRFARFPIPGEPTNIHEKLTDCAVVQQLCRITPRVSLHFPWDHTDDPAGLREEAGGLGLGFDAVNSNTFQDQPGQPLSYRHGSLTATDRAVREQAIEHNLDCIRIGVKLGSKALTLWIGDGTNFPGQQSLRDSLDRYLESAKRHLRGTARRLAPAHRAQAL
jgi:hypothetical protein